MTITEELFKWLKERLKLGGIQNISNPFEIDSDGDLIIDVNVIIGIYSSFKYDQNVFHKMPYKTAIGFLFEHIRPILIKHKIRKVFFATGHTVEKTLHRFAYNEKNESYVLMYKI